MAANACMIASLSTLAVISITYAIARCCLCERLQPIASSEIRDMAAMFRTRECSFILFIFIMRLPVRLSQHLDPFLLARIHFHLPRMEAQLRRLSVEAAQAQIGKS